VFFHNFQIDKGDYDLYKITLKSIRAGFL